LKTRILALIALLFPSIGSAELTGDRHPWFDARFILSGGAYFIDHDYKIGAGVKLPGQEIDFDETFGVDDSETSYTGMLRWNFGEKWSFRAQGFRFKAEGSAVLKENLQWDDYILKAGSNASAGFSNTIIRGFVGRKFSEGPQHEFGAGAGLHWLKVKAYAAGEAFVGDGEVTESVRGDVEADLPLPNIGAWYWYSPSPRWLITSRVDWFSASIDEYSGGLWNAGIGAQFQISENIGLGAEFSYFAIDGDVDKSDWKGKLESSSTGPSVYLSFNW